jgi:hypothetical protein
VHAKSRFHPRNGYGEIRCLGHDRALVVAWQNLHCLGLASLLNDRIRVARVLREAPCARQQCA